ncbi:MAG: hypothetical protein PHT50_03845 [Candidatus Omnitrophica bacterium]|nr:hypothetical protein [Candidatus Omnitrophota bacterium]
MALKKKLSTRKNIAKSLRKAQGKKVKKAAKKIVKKRVKKALKRRPAKRKTPSKKPVLKKRKALKNKKPLSKKLPKKLPKKQEGTIVGLITHYFPHVQAAVIKLKAPLTMGDTVKIKGHTTDFTQVITSMQLNHAEISSAKKGDEIGLQVSSRVRHNDKVYKV